MLAAWVRLRATIPAQVPHGGCTVRARSLRALGLGLICMGLFTTFWGCRVPNARHGLDPGQPECLDEGRDFSETGRPAFKCLSGHCLTQASPDTHSAMPAADSGRSRFFPVPTRPVFSKRGGPTGTIEEFLVPPSPSLEVIPPPPPDGWKPTEPSKQTAYFW